MGLFDFFRSKPTKTSPEPKTVPKPPSAVPQAPLAPPKTAESEIPPEAMQDGMVAGALRFLEQKDFPAALANLTTRLSTHNPGASMQLMMLVMQCEQRAATGNPDAAVATFRENVAQLRGPEWLKGLYVKAFEGSIGKCSVRY
jgi:hypothetical protein